MTVPFLGFKNVSRLFAAKSFTTYLLFGFQPFDVNAPRIYLICGPIYLGSVHITDGRITNLYFIRI